jgi:hypothetical protein
MHHVTVTPVFFDIDQHRTIAYSVHTFVPAQARTEGKKRWETMRWKGRTRQRVDILYK